MPSPSGPIRSRGCASKAQARCRPRSAVPPDDHTRRLSPLVSGTQEGSRRNPRPEAPTGDSDHGSPLGGRMRDSRSAARCSQSSGGWARMRRGTTAAGHGGRADRPGTVRPGVQHDEHDHEPPIVPVRGVGRGLRHPRPGAAGLGGGRRTERDAEYRLHRRGRQGGQRHRPGGPPRPDRRALRHRPEAAGRQGREAQGGQEVQRLPRAARRAGPADRRRGRQHARPHPRRRRP